MNHLIFACDLDGCIGIDGKLPWHIPEDLKRFKTLTTDEVVVMGRKTWESLPIRPLPNRANVIVSKTMSSLPDAWVVQDIEHAIRLCNGGMPNREIFFIGGAEVITYCLRNNLVDKIHMTLVHKRVAGDAYIRPINLENWQITEWNKRIEEDGDKQPVECDYITMNKFKKAIPVFTQWWSP